jgi:hypothetical protein
MVAALLPTPLSWQKSGQEQRDKDQMAKYLQRSCPSCNGYVGIALGEPGRNTPLQAVNGQCLECGYRLAWIVIRGGNSVPRVILLLLSP